MKDSDSWPYQLVLRPTTSSIMCIDFLSLGRHNVSVTSENVNTLLLSLPFLKEKQTNVCGGGREGMYVFIHPLETDNA